MGKIMAVCSGSGGVGKSTIALSLAVSASKAGKNTILLDVSGISRSCDLILKLESIIVLDMLDVMREQVNIDSALYHVPRYPNLRFACASLDDRIYAAELSSILIALQSMCDILVIDMPTGQYDLGRGVFDRSDDRLIILRPDDASLRSAERFLHGQIHEACRISLVVNRSSKELIRRGLQHKPDAISMILDHPVAGTIPEDISIPASEQQGKAAVECNGPAWNALEELAKYLL